MYYYQDWINAVCNLLEYQVTAAQSATPTGVAAFDNSIPAAISYAENRIQRDLDLLGAVVTIPGPGQTAPILVANTRTQTLPSTNLPAVGNNPQLVGNPVPAGSTITTTLNSKTVTIVWKNHGMSQFQNLAILNPVPVGGLTLGGVYQVASVVDANTLTITSPFAATSAQTVTVIGDGIFVVCSQIKLQVGGVWQPPLEAVTRDFLEYAWPSDVSPGANIAPAQWCPYDQSSFMVGPPPDQAYPFQAVGTMRIVPLSSTNYTNFILQQFFDLYVICSMIYFSAYQRDLGQETDNPQMGNSYETQYQTLLKSATVEEARKKFLNMSPSPSYPVALTAKSQGG